MTSKIPLSYNRSSYLQAWEILVCVSAVVPKRTGARKNEIRNAIHPVRMFASDRIMEITESG